MKLFLNKYAFWVLLLISVALFIPWLGESLFNTKGEPREAIVAMAMLDQHNWVLPVSFGCEIPYKPPFFAWCIALCSLVTGGITEFSSRLPSAIATIALALSTFAFFDRFGKSRRVAFVAAIVLITTVEVWRAASACRVDMVLTACMVGAIYSLYGFFASGRRGWLPWLAILLMSGAFLTKGPVGVFLPCLVIGVYRLLCGDKFWGLFGRLILTGILACIIPMLWYVAAYQQGGQAFLDLVMEENFGRMAGTMSYESHVNPWWYNVVTVVAGMAPYTLLALISLFAARIARSSFSNLSPKSLWYRFVNMHPASLYALVVTLLIFIFYCIPASKRSVYLLPIYPFLSYFVSLLIFKLIDKRFKGLRVYNIIICALGVLLPIVGAFLLPGIVNPIGAIVAVGCFLVSSAGLYIAIRSDLQKSAAAMLCTTLAILCALSAAILPPVLSSKSQLTTAREIETDIPEGPIYSFIDDPYLRFYEIDFYLRDRLRLIENFPADTAAEGYVIVNEPDLPVLLDKYSRLYTFTPVKQYLRPTPLLSHRTPKPIHLLTFHTSQR